MAVRKASALWEGTLKEGKGVMKLGSGAYEGPFTYASRFEEGDGTNPEELIGAALAGCFSMFLSAVLTNDGYKPTSISTSAKVTLTTGEGGPSISSIELTTEATVPDVDEDTFMAHVETSRNNCPVSKALASVEKKVNATLVG